MAASAHPTTAAGPSPASTNIAAQFLKPLCNLPQITKDFLKTYHTVALTSSTQFLPTPIHALPTGAESGTFLAIDIGGTNLRVAIVELLEDVVGGLRMEAMGAWMIPEALKSGDAEKLFVWAAGRMGEVLGQWMEGLGEDGEREKLLTEGIKAGIAFSFPVVQKSHTTALLMPMGKGFTFATNDLSHLVSSAYSTHCSSIPSLPPIHITAITNDSICTLLSTAYTSTATSPSSRAAAGIVVGTGTNATALCPTSKLPTVKLPPSPSPHHHHVLVNTEWSINGTLPALSALFTPFDTQLDATSEKPGFQPFEQMVGGRYIGELVRLAALAAFSPDLNLPEFLLHPYALTTEFCSALESNPSSILSLSSPSSPTFWNPENTQLLLEITTSVSTRAAALVAAATVALLHVNDELSGDVDDEGVVVAYTGTVMERYYNFRERCQGYVDGLVGSGRVRLVEAKEGGVVGAAVLAGMVSAGLT